MRPQGNYPESKWDHLATMKYRLRAGSISIPTEPIGRIPRPVDLIERVAKGDSEDLNLAPLYEDAIRDTIERFEA